MGKQTALIEEHKRLGANIVDFAGWEMPVRYSSIKEEVMAVRKSVGMFDVSHMGEFFFTGTDATKAIDYLMTNDFENSPVGKAVYSPLCGSEGGIIDDAIAYKLDEKQSLLCVNASNIEKDREWILSVLKEQGFECQFTDSSDNYSLIAIQGPDTQRILTQVFDRSFHDYEYYSVHRDEHFIFARTGYTGEDGFEIFGDHTHILKLWLDLEKAGVIPCGLAARDVLRLEVAYPLYGQDLTDKLTPLDCNLKWTVKFNKSDFSGKTALYHYKPFKKLIKLELDKGIPRAGQEVFQHDLKIGEVTSGTMSVTTGKGICLALVDKEVFNKDELHFLEIRGKKHEAKFTTNPFVAGGHK